MSPNEARRVVRISAAGIGVASALSGGIVYRAGNADIRAVLDGLTFVFVIAGFWIVVETIAGGFEQIRRTTQERYDKLQAEQPSALAIAAQAACETHRLLTEQAAEDSPKVRLLQR